MKFALLAGVLLTLGCADPAPSSSPIAVEHAAYIGGGNIDCWTGIDGYLEAAYLGPMAGTTNTYNLYVVPFRAGSGTPDDPYYTPEVYYQIYGDGINGGHSPQCWADTPIAWSENPPGYGYSLRDVRNMFSSALGTSYASIWLHVWNSTAVLHGQPGEECWYMYTSDVADWNQADCSFYYAIGGPSF